MVAKAYIFSERIPIVDKNTDVIKSISSQMNFGMYLFQGFINRTHASKFISKQKRKSQKRQKQQHMLLLYCSA